MFYLLIILSMDNNKEKQKRFLQSKLSYFLLWIIFIIIFYASFFIFWNTELSIENFQIQEIFKKYWIYFPLAFWVLALFFSAFLLFIKFILRLNFLIVNIVIYLLLYWFFLVLWLQLQYFEPRYTDIAIVLIDNYALPLIIASSSAIIFTFIFSFLKKK